ncbi:MAG: hypothetical protein J6Y65_00395 [Eggerthellaceae bacterium]|nr:hypothetical protein [Eggerthellaceae bacterium]
MEKIPDSIALIPGRGVGPETTRVVSMIVDATNPNFAWDIFDGEAYAEEGDKIVFTPEAIEFIKAHKVALCGPAYAQPYGFEDGKPQRLHESVSRGCADSFGFDSYVEIFNGESVLEGERALEAFNNDCEVFASSYALCASASIGEEYAVFETGQQADADIAGMDISNPCSLILAVGLMLNFLAENERAAAVLNAAWYVLQRIGMPYDFTWQATGELEGALKLEDFALTIIGVIQNPPRK